MGFKREGVGNATPFFLSHPLILSMIYMVLGFVNIKKIQKSHPKKANGKQDGNGKKSHTIQHHKKEGWWFPKLPNVLKNPFKRK